MKLDMKGHRRMVIDLGNLDRDTKYGIGRGFYKIGKSLRSTASKQILEKPKTGKTYLVRRGPSGRRFRHVASARGESFANSSGAARRTLGFNVSGSESLEFGLKKNVNTDYVKYLEDPESLNRPALKNSIKANQRNAVVLLEREIKRKVKP